MEAVVVGNFYVNLLAQMRTDYTVQYSRFSDCGTALQGHTGNLWKKKYSSLSLFAYKVRG